MECKNMVQTSASAKAIKVNEIDKIKKKVQKL